MYVFGENFSCVATKLQRKHGCHIHDSSHSLSEAGGYTYYIQHICMCVQHNKIYQEQSQNLHKCCRITGKERGATMRDKKLIIVFTSQK